MKKHWKSGRGRAGSPNRELARLYAALIGRWTAGQRRHTSQMAGSGVSAIRLWICATVGCQSAGVDDRVDKREPDTTAMKEHADYIFDD